MRRLLALLAVIAVPLALNGCSSAGSPDSSPTSRPTLSTPAPNSAAEARAVCTAQAGSTSVIGAQDVIEASGLAASRVHPDVLYVHNDSGDTARFFAMGADGRLRATFTVSGADAVDWEDIEVGPGPEPGASYVYLADIGDNRSSRSEVDVYRGREPSVPSEAPSAPIALADTEKFVLRYPDHAHDAETLLIDPKTGDLVIVTKDLAGTALIFTAPAPLTTGVPIALQAAGQILFLKLTSKVQLPPDAPPLTHAGFLATAGDVSPDGDIIAIRTYSTIWVWAREPGTSLVSALAGTPCEAPSALENQGEAIAFSADGTRYYTTSEGMRPPLHAFDVAAP